ncbi:uncharacterized protein BKA78DRAFT_328846 [Phyllosticta capitalensis]|uniref:uncharacterized protein n=1 Tax=Phyllosticta capitalensis TaxID=121624 RepID=UPI00312CE820
MKTVAIIGAGPSGLVAAKTLLHAFPNNAFRVTVLELNSRVGGMWAMDKGQPGGKADSQMPTNISRFNVCFSDLAWSSVFPDADNDGDLPLFPQLWRVGKYLQAYADRYIPQGVIRLNASVKSTELIQGEGRDRWRVKWEQSHQPSGTPSSGSPASGSGGSSPSAESAEEVEEEFDYLIAATGFMHDPKKHNVAVPDGIPLVIKHSSTFRDLNDLVPADSNVQGNTIVVIGGSMSGCEAAANAALQISNCQSSPSFTGKDFSQFKVYHVMPRPFYILPYYLPPPKADDYDPAPTFAPSDMRMFNLSKRPPGPISPNVGTESATSAANKHKWLQSILGGNQSELGSKDMTFDESMFNDSPYVGISENYAEFVRSGLIVPVRGRAKSIDVRQRDGNTSYVMRVAGTKDVLIDNIAGVVHASGFSPNGSFSWLPQDVRAKMECDENCNRLPLLLNSRCAFNTAVPSLGMISFYQGIFWGVMEMQSYLLGLKWSKDEPTDDDASQAELAEMRALRAAIVQNGGNVPQFWQGDFVGLMEELARNLCIQRNDTGFDGGRAGPVFPARYPPPGTDASEAAKAITDSLRIARAVDSEARFVAWAAFRALQGRWQLTRVLDSKLPGFPSGTFSGTASFNPRYPTDPAFAAEYLYIEDVTLVLETGMQLHATRRYVYRYDRARDVASVWFVKPDDAKAADYLFFEMRFDLPSSSPDDDDDFEAERRDKNKTGWVARGAHPCEADFYTSRCEFRFRGVQLDRFGIRYDVKGPKKDFVSENWYRR